MNLHYRRVGSTGVLSVSAMPAVTFDVGLCAQLAAALDTALQQSAELVLLLRGPAALGPDDLPTTHEDSDALAAVLAQLRGSAKPIIAVLEQAAVGAYLEIALACRVRLARSDARLGFPLLRLGRLPAGGSVGVLTAQVGGPAVFDIFADTPLPTDKAIKLGLVDASFDAEAEPAAVMAAASAYLGVACAVQHAEPDTEFFAEQRKAFAKRYRQQPAPQRLVDAVEAAVKLPAEQSAAVQRQLVADCAASPHAKALAHLFVSEIRGGEVADLPPATSLRPFANVAVIGGGTMGAGIAISCLEAGLSVILLEANDAAMQRGLQNVQRHFHDALARKRLPEARVHQALAALRGSTDYRDLATIDLVIEAVFEDLAVKQEVFRKLDAVCRPGCILATNTSYLDVDAIAAVTARPQDVVGMHFFSPANVMKLVEVVRPAAAAYDALATTVALARRLGKIPVLARVCHGFIGNRMLRQYNREVQLCLIEGASPAQIDGAMERWGLAMGPLAVGDLAGLDIGYRARQALSAEARGDPRSYCIADALVEAGRLGRKSGAGYYRYPDGARDRQIDPAVDEVIRAQAQRHGVSRRVFDDGEIVERLVLALINEGARLLEEGIAQRSGDIDAVYCNGYGFPAFRGGPMYYADQLGIDQVFRSLKHLCERHGAHWKPAPLIESLAQQQGSLSSFQPQRR